MLKGRNITLGVTGSIAAYKAAEVARLLVKAGASVHAVLTSSAQKFVAPATFSALTGNYTRTDMFGDNARWLFPHIELAKTDMIVVAPATANILAKVAHGLADDLLSTTILAAQSPVLFCPAMNVYMYRSPATQANITLLRKYGHHVMEPGSGKLACGEQGEGRMPEPGEIMEKIVGLLKTVRDLAGRRVLVTAGGTREPIDPVRFISNRSSGKMGYALATAAAARGAEVTLVSTPTRLTPPQGVNLIFVETALQMYEKVMECFPHMDIVIKSAAVADYRPCKRAEHKIKKNEQNLIIELEKNPDILFDLGKLKQPHQILVGFAAETENLISHAKQKLKKKNLDLLVANNVAQPGAGFGADTNIAKIFYPDGEIIDLPLMKKDVMAHRILDAVVNMLK
jgi:phosphopantothenoylcysteine decarboxylase/phosphopantothenate--cysteine ligase